MTDYSRIYSLICEGACNPNIAVIDADIRRRNSLRRWLTGYSSKQVLADTPAATGGEKRQTLGDTELWMQLRALRHTAHHMVSPVRAVCMDCGAERRYGSGNGGL